MKVLGIAGREARALFHSAVATIVLALSLAVTGLLFVSDLSNITEARLDGWFETSATIMLFLPPLLAMRSLAEDRRAKNLDVLLAGPTSETQVVVGKFVGLAASLVAFLAATAPAPVLVAAWGDPDPGLIVSGYLGLLLLGLASLAVSLFASALTRSQVVAAAGGFIALLLLWLLEGIGGVFTGPMADVISHLGSTAHLPAFWRGLLRAEDVAYYLSVVAISLMAAVRALQFRSAA